MGSIRDVVRPSALMRAAIAGEIPLSEAPQEWLSLAVYHRARAVLGAGDLAERRAMLGKVEPALRVEVEQEASRLFEKRKTGKA